MAAQQEKQVDVAIVGAGLSGLSAALELSKRGQRVVVLEARDRVGGRTYTEHNDHVGYVDLGGAYAGPTQNRLLRLARQYGVRTFLTYEEGDQVVYVQGKANRCVSDSVFPMADGLLSRLDLNNVIRLIDKMCQEVPVDAPWKAPRAAEWDRMTVQQFFNKHIWTKAAMREATTFAHVNVTSEPYEVSLLWFLWYVASAGGPLRMHATSNGAEERKFVGGSQQISEGLARTIGKDKVLLNRAVNSIEQTSSGVTVRDVHGTTYRASYCIVALAPTLQSRIAWSPPLSARRIQMLQRLPMGSVIKTFMYYRTPFWRNKGLSGTAFIEDEEGLVSLTVDNVHSDGTKPAIMGFVLSERARKTANMSKEERKQRISRLYAKVFQCDEALHPVHYEEKNWAEDEWSGGCYTVMMPPGFITTFGEELRKPVGRVYFAGTETASQWTGYMEGAVQAGERAAREILYAQGKIGAQDIWQDEPEDPEVKARPTDLTWNERWAPSVPGFLRMVLLTTLVGAGVTWQFRHRL